MPYVDLDRVRVGIFLVCFFSFKRGLKKVMNWQYKSYKGL